MIVAAGESVLFVGDDSGDVHALNARTGQFLWTPPNLGKPVIGAPGGLFQQYGGVRDVILVGTRDGSAPNALHGLNLADGTSAGAAFTAASNIGAISGAPAVDYSTQRVYFASRSFAGGPTLWCVQVADVAPLHPGLVPQPRGHRRQPRAPQRPGVRGRQRGDGLLAGRGHRPRRPDLLDGRRGR